MLKYSAEEDEKKDNSAISNPLFVQGQLTIGILHYRRCNKTKNCNLLTLTCVKYLEKIVPNKFPIPAFFIVTN